MKINGWSDGDTLTQNNNVVMVVIVGKKGQAFSICVPRRKR